MAICDVGVTPYKHYDRSCDVKQMFTKIILGIGVLLAIAFIALTIIQIKNEREVGKIWRCTGAVPTENRFSQDAIESLPAPVQRYFLHAIAPETPLATSLCLKMSGSFRLGQDKPWLPMQATEIISTKGLVWKAKIGRGLMQMVGADYYANRSGRVRFSWGLIPLVNAHTADITRSSIGRLAGEWIWLPAALLPERGVTWKAIDDNTIQASLKIDGEPITLTLVIDSDGKLLKFSLPRWGNQTQDGSWAYIPFGGEVQAESSFDKFVIPSQVSAGWWFGTDRYLESFRATIERAEFC